MKDVCNVSDDSKRLKKTDYCEQDAEYKIRTLK